MGVVDFFLFSIFVFSSFSIVCLFVCLFVFTTPYIVLVYTLIIIHGSQVYYVPPLSFESNILDTSFRYTTVFYSKVK